MILCCGEALIDFIPGRTAEGRGAYVPSPGGSVYNVAIGLGRLGLSTGLLGGIAADFFGDMLMERMRASGVDGRYTSRLPRPSTLAFVTLGRDEPEYAFYDEGAADRMWTLKESPPLGEDVSTLHFGSISLLREPAAGAYADLMRREKGQRILTLDPNLRPGLVEDEPAYRARLAELICLADVVKISAADLAWWAPDRSIEDVAEGWLAGGTCLVVVTKGAQGASAFWAGGMHDEPSEPVAEIADAVGAGDAFTSGLLGGLQRAGGLGRDALADVDPGTIVSAMRLAVRVAAVTVSRKGANPPTKAELGLT